MRNAGWCSTVCLHNLFTFICTLLSWDLMYWDLIVSFQVPGKGSKIMCLVKKQDNTMCIAIHTEDQCRRLNGWAEVRVGPQSAIHNLVDEFAYHRQFCKGLLISTLDKMYMGIQNGSLFLSITYWQCSQATDSKPESLFIVTCEHNLQINK